MLRRWILSLVLLCSILPACAITAQATVNEVTASNRYTADGSTTAFAYTFKIFLKTDIAVYVDGTLKTVDTDYSVSGLAESGGGTVTFVTAPANATIVTLIRKQPASQGSSYTPNEAFPAARVEKDLDKLAMQIQQLKEQLLRIPKAPVQETTSIGDLPAKTTRASKYAAYDSDGNPTTTAGTTSSIVTSSYVETLLGEASGDAFVDELIGDGLTDHGSALASGDQLPYRDISANTGGRTTVLELLGQGTNALTEEATPDNGADYIPMWDASANTGKKVKIPAITNGTMAASTSGTSIDFTSIPAGVKRITIMFKGVSTSGTSNPLIQIGDAGGIEATGYLGASTGLADATAVAVVNYTTGFGLAYGSAANLIHGAIVLTLMDAATFTWVAHGNVSLSSSQSTGITSGSKALSAELDRVRITTVGGSDTFDAGNINISYER